MGPFGEPHMLQFGSGGIIDEGMSEMPDPVRICLPLWVAVDSLSEIMSATGRARGK